uniref:Uncharacterized protein n=1 Tax=Oryza punctata TaxID=4537 RepID=A0A0E0KS97_ORYPU
MARVVARPLGGVARRQPGSATRQCSQARARRNTANSETACSAGAHSAWCRPGRWRRSNQGQSNARAGWTLVAQGGGDGAHDSGTAPWQRQNLQKNRKEAAAKLKNDKGKGSSGERGRCSPCGSRVAARRASRRKKMLRTSRMAALPRCRVGRGCDPARSFLARPVWER